MVFACASMLSASVTSAATWLGMEPLPLPLPLLPLLPEAEPELLPLSWPSRNASCVSMVCAWAIRSFALSARVET
jgi:hypothetical protein